MSEAFSKNFSSGAVGGRDYFSGYTDIFLYEAQQQTVNDWRKMSRLSIQIN